MLTCNYCSLKSFFSNNFDYNFEKIEIIKQITIKENIRLSKYISLRPVDYNHGVGGRGFYYYFGL